MDKYKLSQTPTGKKPKKQKVKAPPRKHSQSTDPKMVIIAVVAMLAALVLGGVIYARYVNKQEPVLSPAAETQKRANETGAVAPEVQEGVTTAIGNKTFSDLDKYYAKNVRIIIPRSSVNLMVGSRQVGNYVNNPLDAAQTPWDWNVPPQDLSAWQQGPHGEHFIGNVIVGISPDGTVIAIHIDEDGKIDSIFIAPVGDLTNPPPTTPANPDTTTDPTPETPDTPTPVITEESD